MRANRHYSTWSYLICNEMSWKFLMEIHTTKQKDKDYQTGHAKSAPPHALPPFYNLHVWATLMRRCTTIYSFSWATISIPLAHSIAWPSLLLLLQKALANKLSYQPTASLCFAPATYFRFYGQTLLQINSCSCFLFRHQPPEPATYRAGRVNNASFILCHPSFSVPAAKS